MREISGANVLAVRSRRITSSARCRATAISHAAGLSGTPRTFHTSSARQKASWTTSSASARLWTPNTRVSAATRRPDWWRNRCSLSSIYCSEGLRPSDSPTRSLARRFAGALRSRGSLAALVRCGIRRSTQVIPPALFDGLRTLVIHLHDWTDFDRSAAVENRAAARKIHGLLDVARLDHAEAADEILRLGIRSIGHGLVLAAHDLSALF